VEEVIWVSVISWEIKTWAAIPVWPWSMQRQYFLGNFVPKDIAQRLSGALGEAFWEFTGALCAPLLE